MYREGKYHLAIKNVSGWRTARLKGINKWSPFIQKNEIYKSVYLSSSIIHLLIGIRPIMNVYLMFLKF
ncbi:hypothetical protein DO763_18300 [Salmonella enterica subsp. enterica serovar Wangata]|nr:hypothetical protein [Salmonella enterica subsp. enterica serovar Wangata]